jgi:hypothetical protein
LRDAEERETSQKKMYDRMFQALDDSSGAPNSARNRGDNGSSPSIGSREIDILNRQFHEQMAERVKDLEMQVMTKE